MSSASPPEVVVTSKHSLGSVVGQEVSHAQMGEIWLDRHLESKGKTKADFAQRLWDENVTAVAEVSAQYYFEMQLTPAA
jgi:tRNA ligase